MIENSLFQLIVLIVAVHKKVTFLQVNVYNFTRKKTEPSHKVDSKIKDSYYFHCCKVMDEGVVSRVGRRLLSGVVGATREDITSVL
jgi:hypothetical protein